MLKGSRILSGSSVNVLGCYCLGGCGYNIPYISAYVGCHLLPDGCLWSTTIHITEDARPNIGDALLALLFRMWLGAWVYLFCTWRQLICRIWIVQFQCQCFTINSSISESDHTCETRHPEPEIEMEGYSQTLQNPLIDGYRSGFGLPRVSGSGFGRVWNQTDPCLRSKPGPLAGYPDPLLTLPVSSSSILLYQ
jgi:hypothetical protein